MNEKVVNTVIDQYGNETPSAVLYQEGGQLYLWEINCWSSQTHNLGNCQCVSHPPTTDDPVSTSEVIQRFGAEALEGFEQPGTEQLVYNEFGVELQELETYLRISYHMGQNPLPFLRKKTTHPVVFLDGNLNFEAFKGEEVVFVVNSRGEISAEIATNN